MKHTIHSGGIIYYSDSHTSKSAGVFIGIVPKNVQKDRNIIMIVDERGNAKRVSEVYYPIAQACVGGTQVPFNLLITDSRNLATDVKASDAPREMVDNRAEKVDAHLTTDGMLYATKKDADQHQVDLDFREWSGDEVHNRFNCSRNKMLSYLRDNKKELTAFLRRIK